MSSSKVSSSQICVYFSYLPCVLYVLCISYPESDNPSNTSQRAEIMRIHIKQSPQASFLLAPDNFLDALFLVILYFK